MMVLTDKVIEKRFKIIFTRIRIKNINTTTDVYSFNNTFSRNTSWKKFSKIRQLLYPLYRSKKISKTVYKNLITLFKNGDNIYEHSKQQNKAFK